MTVNQSLDVLENNMTRRKLHENETEVKQALNTLIVEAEKGDNTAIEVLTFIMDLSKNRKSSL